MICRLCLITINVEKKISIFTASDNEGESQIVKLIAKYFHLEVTQHDAISTTLCLECWNHIDEFDKFCIFVDEKQNTLRNEFLEVKCDILLEASNIDEQNEESLCDIKDVLQEAVSEEGQPISKPREINIFEESITTYDAKNAELSDDDIPLEVLRRKCFKNSQFENPKPAELKKPIKCKDQRSYKGAKKKRENRIVVVNEKVVKKHDEGCKPESDYQNVTSEAVQNNKDELPSTSAKRKRTNQCSQKPTAAEAEDMDIFISQHMQLKCDLCDVRFEKFSEVRPHFSNQHKCGEYIKCCGRRHNKRIDLFEHIKWHFDPEYFKCEECGKLMKNRYCLGVHTLTKHLKKEDLAYNCEYCDKRFARPSMLTNHLKTTHEAKRMFACQHCDKSFILKNALEKHIRSIHDNIFPHICDVCGMKFKFKPSFETHVLEHQGIIAPPVKCPECGDWVKNKNRLRLHMTTHNKVDVHCKYCGRICASLSAMRAHIQYMHRRPPSYKCSFCGKFFKTPKILKEHVATHTGENLYSCPHCTKEFRSSANMYVHIKRQHTQEWLAAQVVRSKTPPNVKNS